MSEYKLTMIWMLVGVVASACLFSNSAQAEQESSAAPLKTADMVAAIAPAPAPTNAPAPATRNPSANAPTTAAGPVATPTTFPTTTGTTTPATPTSATTAAKTATEVRKSAEENDPAARHVGVTREAASAGQALVLLPMRSGPPPDARHSAEPSGGPVRTYALVDQTLVPQVVTLLPPGTRSSLVEIQGLQDASVRAVMPVLIELPDEDLPREAVARLTMHWAREHHAASWMSSRRPIQELADVLALAMMVRLAGDVQFEGQFAGSRPALLRLADSRVLGAVPAILRRGQLEALMGVVQQWRYLDRNEVLGALQPPRSAGNEGGDDMDDPPFSEKSLPLVLGASQVESFRAASLPDEVLQIANMASGGRLNGLAGPVRHAYVVSQIQKAKSLGMASSQEIGLYISIALRKGEVFLNDARWRGVEAQARVGRIPWIDALTSDDLWP